MIEMKASKTKTPTNVIGSAGVTPKSTLWKLTAIAALEARPIISPALSTTRGATSRNGASPRPELPSVTGRGRWFRRCFQLTDALARLLEAQKAQHERLKADGVLFTWVFDRSNRKLACQPKRLTVDAAPPSSFALRRATFACIERGAARI
jgi:hypothetical protein